MESLLIFFIMQYWAVIDGAKQGPMELEQLLNLNITPETKVWREGLINWIAAKDLSELSGIFMAHSAPTPPAYNEGSAPQPEVSQPQATYTSQPQPQQSYTQPQPPCPPTNLIWAILSMVCCCQIFGIVAIVYAAQVSSLYAQGRYLEAQKASSNAAMWSIISLVIGAITYPIFLFFSVIGNFC
ncbi:MAG: CD225/dispanin family protein [Muribaculaceae bacterium]